MPEVLLGLAGFNETLLRPTRDYSYDESKQQLKRTNLPTSGRDSTANLREILGRLGGMLASVPVFLHDIRSRRARNLARVFTLFGIWLRFDHRTAHLGEDLSHFRAQEENLR